jgi:hypothetical protein
LWLVRAQQVYVAIERRRPSLGSVGQYQVGLAEADTAGRRRGREGGAPHHDAVFVRRRRTVGQAAGKPRACCGQHLHPVHAECGARSVVNDPADRLNNRTGSAGGPAVQRDLRLMLAGATEHQYRVGKVEPFVDGEREHCAS